MAAGTTSPPAVQRSSGSTSLADVIDRILDKGLVIDAWVRVSIVGLEILTVEARVVVASVDTYIRYAEAISRMQLASAPGQQQEAPKQLEAEPQPEAKPESQLPSEDEIRSYLTEHPKGMGLDQLASHFGVARDALAPRLRELQSKGGLLAGASGDEQEEEEERGTEEHEEGRP